MSLIHQIVASHYRIIKKLGQGSFGEVYLAQHTRTNERYAIKFENITSPKKTQLQLEYRLYLTFDGCVNIPQQYQFCHLEKQNFLVMEYLGPSIEELRIRCGGKLSLKTVLMLANEMLSAIEYIHRKCFLHRDIKPDNFVIGRGKNSKKIYLIDFGLCSKYTTGSQNEHIPFLHGKFLTGTARYASINALKGYEQSRRDDLESLGYVLIYLLKGTLPWSGIKTPTKDLKLEAICKMKESIPLSELCANLPPEFEIFLNAVRSLSFTERPLYSYYRNLFRERLIKENYCFDTIFDWLNKSDTTKKPSIPKPHFVSSMNIDPVLSRFRNIQDDQVLEPKKRQKKVDPLKHHLRPRSSTQNDFSMRKSILDYRMNILFQPK